MDQKRKELEKTINCKSDKCAKGKGECRLLKTGTQSCTGDDEKGWTCTGIVRLGCFCLDPKEQVGKIAPTPASAPTPTETACPNKFDDQKEVIGASDKTGEKGKTEAQTEHDKIVEEDKTAGAKACDEHKCPGEKQSCRLYYTTTEPKCTESPFKEVPGWNCKSQFRGGCFCFDNAESGLLSMAGETGLPAGQEYAAHRPFRGKTMLVGVVLAEGCDPNHSCTAGLVTNPDEIAGTPGVVVKKVEVPERRNARGHATLQGIVVASNDAKRQPADGPITFVTPESGTATAIALDVALVDNPEEPVSVPIDELPPHRKHREEASAPPMLPDNGVCIVHDKYSGNSHATGVSINGTDVPVLAESQAMTVFRPGDAAKTGENEYTITDGGVAKTCKLTSPSISIAASQTTLEQNQATQFQVTLSDLGSIPDSSWSSSGGDEGGEGYILLTIKNDSPNTTTVSGGNLITVKIHKSDAPRRNFHLPGHYHGAAAGAVSAGGDD